MVQKIINYYYLLSSPGIPVEEIPFPAIALCNSGSLEDNLMDAVARQFRDFIKKSFTNITLDWDAFDKEHAQSKGEENSHSPIQKCYNGQDDYSYFCAITCYN